MDSSSNENVVLFCMKNELFSGLYTLLSMNKNTLLYMLLTHTWIICGPTVIQPFSSVYCIEDTHTHSSAKQSTALHSTPHNRCLDIVSLYYVYNFIVQRINSCLDVNIPKKLDLILIKSYSLLICIRIVDKIMLRNACSETFYTLTQIQLIVDSLCMYVRACHANTTY